MFGLILETETYMYIFMLLVELVSATTEELRKLKR